MALEKKIVEPETIIKNIPRKIKCSIHEIADLKDSHKKEVAKIKSDNKKKIDTINSENEATIAQLNEESDNTETSLINTIEDMMAEPLKINPDFLLMRSQTNDECNLYTSPSDQASVITPLKKGTEVENLVIVGDNKDCLLYTSPSPRDVEESRMPSSA